MTKLFGKARTTYGIIAIVIHLLLYGPFLVWANRVEPWVAGIPFFLVYLWIIYVALLIVYIVGAQAVDKEEGIY